MLVGDILILGDRNFNNHDRDIILEYLPHHFRDVRICTISRVDQVDELFSERSLNFGSMNNYSHVLVACLTPIVVNPIQVSANRITNVRKYNFLTLDAFFLIEIP